MELDQCVGASSLIILKVRQGALPNYRMKRDGLPRRFHFSRANSRAGHRKRKLTVFLELERITHE
ncbi:MAG: hypothetical protein Udaeo2_32280 [Candidatus Udaeobacter sp.]|jgi:hypothetical protein|nr:MAG: hypothetical protein Udaeo2_32280 [Candidatus Udaeobacter sp.]